MNDIHKFKSPNLLIDFLKKEAETNLLMEICGLISFVDETFIYKRMINLSNNVSSFFKISPMDYLKFINEYGCFCVFHSHLFGDENLSKKDKENCDNCCKSFLIYSVITGKFKLYEPKNKDYDVNINEKLIKYL
jgi:hypothetical protein